jgi:phage protein D
MTLKRPDAELTLDGRSLSAAEAALVSAHVHLSVSGAHDRFRCALGFLSPFVDVEPGADAELKLGFGDELETVLTGTVTSVGRAPWGFVVEGLAATSALSGVRVGRSYVGQTVGDVVSDLVSGAGGTTGEVSASHQLAAFHVDERRSVWSHVRSLARLTGSELSTDPEGGVNFRPVKTGSADHSLRHGADLVAWDVRSRDTSGAAVDVVPFGAASEEGSEKWHVLLREPDGGSPSAPTIVPGALRDRDAAQALQDALAAAVQRRAKAGTLVLVGDNAVRAGDLVELTDMPSGEDGTLRALTVTHALARDGGYRTSLTVEGAG